MSTDDQTTGQGGYEGGWEPIPQSEGYDGDATAFVQLPPDFMLDGVPLEAPGHGYVPPMITPLQPLTPATADPATTGTWNVHLPTEAEQTQYFDQPEYPGQPGYDGRPEYAGPDRYAGSDQYSGPDQYAGPVAYPAPADYDGQPEYGGQGGYGGQPGHVEYADHQAEYTDRAEHVEYADQDPHATAEWHFGEVTAPAGDSAGSTDPGATGQWEIPALPETAETVETAETPEAPSYAEAPATLPGGAPAPWALQQEPAAATAADEAEVEIEAGAEGSGGAEGTAAETAAPQDEARDDTQGEARDDVSDSPDALDGTDDTAVPDDTAGLDDEAGPDGSTASDVSDASDGHGEGPAEASAPASVPAPVPAPVTVPSAYASTDSEEHPHASYTLRVNGADRPVTGSWIGESLLYVLRERLGLAGAKDGCSQGECGACNVQVDGRLVASCLVPAATAAGSEVRTVEGLAVDGEPSDVQRAMSKCGTVQCGFCIPGMCMTVHDLLEGNHAPTDLETRQALAGNLCRCSGYRGVLEAVRDVVAEREASAAATAADASDEIRVPHQIPHPHDGGMA
ncbi:2Fe-2S iron-sulfur cluster-binding protein [Streptomyces sp. NPDC093089]|uniref:2Fe-2S iron-sulfur cluster-binding protein n=1 Tax=Streptomyces sp. NPDC093089 TaxID=3366024 RepID=UPI00380E5954